MEQKIMRKLEEILDELRRGRAHTRAALWTIETLLRIEWRLTMAKLDDLTKQIQENTDLEASAIEMIQGLAAQLAEAANDSVKVSALAKQLHDSAAALAAAITANTPAATPAEPPAPATR